MSKIKLIAIDLDHTLTGFFNRVSKENINTLLKVQEMGVKVIIVTGRAFPRTISIAKKIQLQNYSNCVITLNGALTYDFKNQKIISKKIINQNDLIKTFEIDPQNLFSKIFINEKNQYFCFKKTWTIRILNFILQTKIKTINLKELSQQKIVSGFWIGKLNKIKKYHLFNNRIHNLEFKTGFPFTSQFNNTTKAKAVFEYAKKFNIDSSEIMAIGDSMNDYELIKNVGYGIAMENAHKAIKKIAFMTTLHWKKNGVAKAIKRLIF